MLGNTGLVQCRHIRNERRALGVRNREAAQLALFDVTGHERKRDVQDLGVAGDRRHDRGAATLERHLHDIEFVRELEQSLDGHVRGRSITRACVAVLARICLQQLDELLHICRRHRRMNGDRLRRARKRCDRDEVLEGIVGRLRLHQRLDDEVLVHDQQRVSVGRRASCGKRAGNATGAREIFHIELRAAILRQFLRGDAGDNIGRSASPIGHNHLHRPRRVAFGSIRLLSRGSDGAKRQQPQYGQQQRRFHRNLLRAVAHCAAGAPAGHIRTIAKSAHNR